MGDIDCGDCDCGDCGECCECDCFEICCCDGGCNECCGGVHHVCSGCLDCLTCYFCTTSVNGCCNFLLLDVASSPTSSRAPGNEPLHSRPQNMPRRHDKHKHSHLHSVSEEQVIITDIRPTSAPLEQRLPPPSYAEATNSQTTEEVVTFQPGLTQITSDKKSTNIVDT